MRALTVSPVLLATPLLVSACSGAPAVKQAPPKAETARVEKPPMPAIEVVAPNRFAISGAWWASDTSPTALFGVDPVVALQVSTNPNEPGVVLGGIITSSRLVKIGLRPGDILRSVRGEPVAQIPQVVTALQGLVDRPAFTLEIFRQGRPMTLIYEVR